jgi:thiamine biosynthesis lipoprotein
MKRRNGFLPAAALLSAVLFVSAVWGGRWKTRKFSADVFGAFDTLVTFTAFAKDEAEFERYARIVREEMTRLHCLFDIYNNYDGLVNLKTLNDAAGTSPMETSPDIIELLEMAKDAYEDTGGAVNVALGPVLAVWRDCRESAGSGGGARVPSVEELRAAAVYISPDDIVTNLERSTVFLRHKGMRLDVGAIAKGRAAQKTMERLSEAGMKSGIINAGGNVVISGPPLDGRPAWNIGVQAAGEGDLSKLADVLELGKGSVATSGSGQRYYIAGEKRRHHIIDPDTLFPAEGVESVTVIHPDSAAADILSTAAFIMRPEGAKRLLAGKGAEALWVMSDGTEIWTEGYARFSKNRAHAAKRKEAGVMSEP